MGEWISVDDKLPPIDTEVLVICWYSYWLARIDFEGDWIDTQEGTLLDEVTYWLPIPTLSSSRNASIWKQKAVVGD